MSLQFDNSEARMNAEELRQQVEKLTWVHSIDLGNGMVTPGLWGPPNPLISRAFAEIDFNGRKVLDIGCWDGLWAFEAEKRGASEVVATDCVSQRWNASQPTFQLAHRALDSKVTYYPDLSVYDISDKFQTKDFDIIIFCGLYYHLKNPLLALTRLRQVMRSESVIVIEGEAIYDERQSYAKFLYHTALYEDPSTWWIPTIACLREWVECSYFDIIRDYRKPTISPRRTDWNGALSPSSDL
jgi:tRNA (mo5U34)-methyltransferase